MIKLADILKETNNDINISDKLMGWIDTGDFSSNEEVSYELVNYLDQEGYKDEGMIYRVLFFNKDELMSLNSMYLKDVILKRDNKAYKSFCKDYSGVEYILKHYSEHEDHTVVFKQNSPYYDLIQFFEDKYDELELEDEILGEIENTQEVIAKINPSLSILKII